MKSKKIFRTIDKFQAEVDRHWFAVVGAWGATINGRHAVTGKGLTPEQVKRYFRKSGKAAGKMYSFVQNAKDRWPWMAKLKRQEESELLEVLGEIEKVYGVEDYNGERYNNLDFKFRDEVDSWQLGFYKGILKERKRRS